jgi:hypothetical protein
LSDGCPASDTDEWSSNGSCSVSGWPGMILCSGRPEFCLSVLLFQPVKSLLNLSGKPGNVNRKTSDRSIFA